MTSKLFQEWLKRFDDDLKAKNRQVALLYDNAPSHILGELKVSNVELISLPPNATSKIQPMDAGIIAAFKRRYRRYQLQDALDRDEQGDTDIYNVDQLTAMRWSKAAWEELPESVIANCFKHTGPFDNRIQARTEANLDTEEEAIVNEL